MRTVVVAHPVIYFWQFATWGEGCAGAPGDPPVPSRRHYQRLAWPRKGIGYEWAPARCDDCDVVYAGEVLARVATRMLRNFEL